MTAGTVESKDVPVFVRGLGTVQAFNMVSVKARVDGQITKIFFTEGQDVKTGDPLVQVDPRPYQAALDQARDNKQKDEAQLRGAQLDLERYAKLLPQGFQTRQSYDQQTATVGGLQSSIKADEAQIEAAQLNLDYTTVRSPIDGRTGARMVDIGNPVLTRSGLSRPSLLLSPARQIPVPPSVPRAMIRAEYDEMRKGFIPPEKFSFPSLSPVCSENRSDWDLA